MRAAVAAFTGSPIASSQFAQHVLDASSNDSLWAHDYEGANHQHFLIILDKGD